MADEQAAAVADPDARPVTPAEMAKARRVSRVRTCNSLFRRMNSLLGRKRFPVPGKQGICAQRTGIAARMDLSNRRIGQKFAKFPVIFPVVREFEDQGRSGLGPTLDVT
jgi:hypothetical protein